MKDKAFYDNGIKHIKDILKLLDLKLYKMIKKYRAGYLDENNINSYRGLVISDEEIDEVFKEDNFVDEEIKALNEEIEKIQKEISVKVQNSIENKIFLPIVELENIFDLSEFEITSIIMALALELNKKYQKIYGYLQDNINLKNPTFDLVCKFLEFELEDVLEVRKSFSNHSLFSKMILKDNQIDKEDIFLSTQILIDEKIINFIICGKEIDSSINHYIEYVDYNNLNEKLFWNINIQQSIVEFLNNTLDYQKKIIYLYGKKGSGKKFHAKKFCQMLNKSLILLDIKKVIESKEDLKQILNKFLREVILYKNIPAFKNFEILFKHENIDKLNIFFKEIDVLKGIVFILSKEKLKDTSISKNFAINKISVPDLNIEDKINVWRYFAALYKVKECDWIELVNKYDFSIGEIKNVIKIVKDYYCWDSNNKDLKGIICKVAQNQITHSLNKNATKINPIYTFEDIVLPDIQRKQLEEICNQVKNRYIVFSKWNFEKKLSYGKGLSILFSGLPGTGKTMSAHVLANELKLELYKIDLSQIVSKYIGETEKSLHSIFEEAKKSKVILFFDEADSIFGKRSEVKEANDRYANIETSYLLQKIEEYDGITILATNFLKNIDSAFMRRINFVVDFPFPYPKNRKILWEKAFTKETPMDDDIDFEFLSEKFELSGANIKNIALSSAFLAAQENSNVTMKQILISTKKEMEKLGKLFVNMDLEEYKHLL